LIRPFETDPDLLRNISDPRREELVRGVSVERLSLPVGFWVPPPADQDALGFLVVDGFMVRQVSAFRRHAAELIGPGDHVAAHALDAEPSAPFAHGLRALTPTTIGVLDVEFTSVLARYPSIAATLLERAAAQARRLVRQGTIAQLPGLASRLVVLFWQLADQWGQREGGEVVLPIPLGHQLLADLVSAQRESVSRALAALRSHGIVDRRSDGGWVLHGLPPQTLEELILIQGLASRAALADREGI
jgi:CRP-like cAMP-binding protein